MEAIAVAIIAAGAAIASAIISAIVSTRKLDKTLVVHDERTSGQKAELSHEHSDLSKEHGSLSKENQQLLQAVGTVNNGVSFLKEESIREAARKTALQGERLDLEKTIGLLSSLQAKLEILQHENDKLMIENKRLKEELLRERAHGAEPHEEGWDVDM